MSFQKKCEEYFAKRNHKVKRLLDRVPAGYEREDYHDLRLEVKKLRAFLVAAGQIADLDAKKCLKPYRYLFKAAGRVRDTQMATALLAKQRPMKWLLQYKHELETEGLLQEKEFSLAVDQKVKERIKRVREKVLAGLKEIKKNKVREYLLKEEQKAKKIIRARRISIEDAHALRKKLKEIGYIAKLIKSKTPAESEQIEKVQEALGSWHDLRQLAERLKHDASKQDDKQRKAHMLNLEKAISKKASGMFTGIGRSLRQMSHATLKSPAKGEALLF